MGFQDLGSFGHPRNPAIRTTGLLTFALAGLSPAEHTSVYWSQPAVMLTIQTGQLMVRGLAPLRSDRLVGYSIHPVRER